MQGQLRLRRRDGGARVGRPRARPCHGVLSLTLLVAARPRFLVPPSVRPPRRRRRGASVVPLDEVTELLRAGDPSRVETALVDLLVSEEEEWHKDGRDLMGALAPYHDCARCLGADISSLFRRAAAAGPASFRELVEEFGRRTDVTPRGFGFCVERTTEGLRYADGAVRRGHARATASGRDPRRRPLMATRRSW